MRFLFRFWRISRKSASNLSVMWRKGADSLAAGFFFNSTNLSNLSGKWFNYFRSMQTMQRNWENAENKEFDGENTERR